MRAPNGTHRTMSMGYVAAFNPGHPLSDPSGYVREHRMLAYDAGLLSDLSMHVHHRDGDKLNNDLANLEVVPPADHHRHHDVLGSIHRVKTHCPADHEYDEANTRWYKGRRWCRACDNARGRAKRAGARKP